MSLKQLLAKPQQIVTNPMPCSTCACAVYWHDPYGRLHCGDCNPPPSPLVVKKQTMVVNNPDGTNSWEEILEGDLFSRGDSKKPVDEPSPRPGIWPKIIRSAKMDELGFWMEETADGRRWDVWEATDDLGVVHVVRHEHGTARVTFVGLTFDQSWELIEDRQARLQATTEPKKMVLSAQPAAVEQNAIVQPARRRCRRVASNRPTGPALF